LTKLLERSYDGVRKMARILIIEDEKILAEMYREKFTKAGFNVFLAFDAKEGFEITKREKPDLILLDILLPKEDGISYLKWLKNEAKISSIPVFAFSNYDDPKTKKEALELGVKDYIIKANYTPEELVQKIKNYLKENK
jgi:DNA-binding response OmpR family regulator